MLFKLFVWMAFVAIFTIVSSAIVSFINLEPVSIFDNSIGRGFWAVMTLYLGNKALALETPNNG